MTNVSPSNQGGESVPAFDPRGSVKPTTAQTVDQIKAYMDAHGLSYTSTMSKDDLLNVVNGGGK
nr:MAG TPA: dimeris T4 recombination endonuclease VII [Caudoviricetes sp.]